MAGLYNPQSLRSTMSRFQEGSVPSKAVADPTPMPANIPKVEEVGATSAPLKSAAFFIGAHCREYNGALYSPRIISSLLRLFGHIGYAI
jgi:hypothetical protein